MSEELKANHILFVQPNFKTGPAEENCYYFPYTSFALWEYAQQNPRIQDAFDPVVIYQREDFWHSEQTAKYVKVAFISLYVWNKHYCCSLAKMLKSNNPDIKIIMGGPEVPSNDMGTFFITHPYVDSIVEGEGEIAAEKILLATLDGEPLKPIYKEERIKDLSILPSPYLNSFAKKVMEWTEPRDAKHTWIPTIETDRGCPYGCTFCDWGSATASKMYQFPLQRILDELDWAANQGMDYIALTSSNFGIYKERDLAIAEHIVWLHEKTGHLKGISVSYAKNSNDTVFEIVKMFTKAGIQTGLMVSLQTTTPQVLENIDRKNMAMNNIKKIAQEAKDHSLPLHTELILGLPGETTDTWENSLEEVMQAGVSNFDIFYLQLLENAPMNLNQVEQYDLRTYKAYDYFYGTVEDKEKDNFPESVNVIQSTSTMSTDQMVESAMLSWFITGMHMYGFTNILADHLHKNNKINYIDFYKGLRNFLRTEYEPFSAWEDATREAIENWSNDGIFDLTFPHNNDVEFAHHPGLRIAGWEAFHSLAMAIHYQDQVGLAVYYAGLYAMSEYKLDASIVADHIHVSKAQINRFGDTQATTLILSSDLLNTNYINVIARYSIVKNDIKEHCKYLVMARRRSWHLNVIKYGKTTK